MVVRRDIPKPIAARNIRSSLSQRSKSKSSSPKALKTPSSRQSLRPPEQESLVMAKSSWFRWRMSSGSAPASAARRHCKRASSAFQRGFEKTSDARNRAEQWRQPGSFPVDSIERFRVLHRSRSSSPSCQVSSQREVGANVARRGGLELLDAFGPEECFQGRELECLHGCC